MIPTRSPRHLRTLLTAAILIALVAAVLIQQSRIRALQADHAAVSSVLEAIRNSQGGDHLSSAPTVTVIPGQGFSIEILSDNRKFYTLAGTAELSPSGSGVVLKARIQQKELPEGP